MQNPMQDAKRQQLRSAGFSEEEINNYFASSQAPKPRGAAAAESTRVAPAGPRKPGLSAGQFAAGLGRSALQGASFGFGEEAEAALTGRPVEEIRGEMKQFREAYPKTAFVGEVGGGLLTGGTGAMRAGAAAAGRGIVRRALSKVGVPQAMLAGAGKATQLGVPQAMLAGAGSTEGGLPERAAGAAAGGIVGGTFGAAINPVVQKGAGLIARRFQPTDAAAAQTVELATKANIPIEEIGPRAERMAALSPEARLMDVIGRPAARRAAGIAAIPGRPSETLERAMEARYATRPERMQEALTRTTGRGPENIYETIDDIVQRRKEVSDPLYTAFREQPPVQSPEIEKYLQRPAFARAATSAREVLANKGIDLPMIDTPQGPMPARTPEFLDYVKRGLDDALLDEKSPNRREAIREAREEFVQLLEDAIPGYQEARNAFAGETALKIAIEDGAAMARGRTDSRQVRQVLSKMTDSERELFQRGYIDGLRVEIDEGKLTAGKVRAPAFQKRLTEVFGDQAQDVIDALEADVALIENAARVVRGARTAPLGQDIAEERGAESYVGKLARSLIEPRRTAARAISGAEGFVFSGLREGTRQQRAEELLRPASEIGPLLSRIAREGAVARQKRRVGGAASGAFGTYLGNVTGRTIGGG